MDLPKFHPNERIDQPDMDFLSLNIDEDQRRQIRGLVAGDAVSRVVDGFTFSIQSATVLRILLGKAITGFVTDDEGIAFGQLLSAGVASQDVSFAALGAATFGVWIRFVYADGELDNRTFFDEIGNDEVQQAVDTRRIAGWNVVVASSAPGAEWLRIYDVVWNAADLNTSTINDKRFFLFEGNAAASPAFSSAWGAGNDRNNDRASFGVKTLERFVSAVTKKLEEIQSSTARWWATTVEPLDKKVSRFGDMTLTGDYLINGNLEIVNSLTVDADIIVAGSIVNLSNSVSLYKSRNSASAALPILGTDAGIQLDEINTSNNALGPPLYFTHHGADGGSDGLAFFSKRIAEDNVHLKLGYLQDGTVVTTPFEWDPINGIFSAANTDKASGVFTTNGAGGIASQITQNCSVAVSGTDILVTFTAGLGDANYGVLVQNHDVTGLAPTIPHVEGKAAGQFVIKVVQWNGGTQLFQAVDMSANARKIDFRVWHV